MMIYRETIHNSAPSSVMKKLNNQIKQESLAVIQERVDKLKDGESIEGELLEEILEVCSLNKININNIFYQKRAFFLGVPKAS